MVGIAVCIAVAVEFEILEAFMPAVEDASSVTDIFVEVSEELKSKICGNELASRKTEYSD